MFTAALFIITKDGNNPHVHQLMNEHIMSEYYSAIKSTDICYNMDEP